MFSAKIDQIVYDFNCAPLAYVDLSWLAPSCKQPVEFLRKTSDQQAKDAVNNWLLKQMDAANRFDFNFDVPHKRILLLDPRVLRDLSLLIGLNAAHHVISRWVRLEERQILKSCLGHDIYSFYRREVLHWPAVARLPVSDVGLRRVPSEFLLSYLAKFGARLLLMSCDVAGSAAYARANWKLPKLFSSSRCYPALAQDRALRVADFCINCVVRTREPSWHWLF
jgi:hypothetical protein